MLLNTLFTLIKWQQLTEEYGWVPYVVVILLILLAGYLLSRFLNFLLDRFYKLNHDVIKVDATQFRFTKNAINWIIGFLVAAAVIYSVPTFRALAITIFAGAGIFAAILGLASQQAFSNIVSGIFIVIFKPFRVNDTIQIGDNIAGIVEDITLRHTVIRNYEFRRIIIPNSKISEETIINASITDPKVRRHFVITVGHDTDLDLAMKLLQEEAEKHPLCIDNRTPEEIKAGAPVVLVKVVAFLDYAIQLRAWVWSATNANSFDLYCDLNRNVKLRFKEEGISFPYPHRVIIQKGNEPSQ